MAKTKTSITPTKRKTMKPRGKSERTKILESLERIGKTETGFYDHLSERAFDPEDNFALKELLARLSPIPKQVAPLVQFDFPKKAKPHVQADYVLNAIAAGKIPSDIGNVFIQSIKSMIDIEEYTDLKERIEGIETALGINNE
jgi:hypothetical protein